MSLATSILEVTALSFTSYAILLKIMAESPASYPNRAIRRVATASGLMLIGGTIITTHLLFDISSLLKVGLVFVGLSFIVGIIAPLPHDQG